MTTFSILDVEIQEIEGGKTLFRDSLTTFPIAMVILDPYTLESSWILDTADRVLSHFQGADVRVAFVVAGSDPGQKYHLEMTRLPTRGHLHVVMLTK